ESVDLVLGATAARLRAMEADAAANGRTLDGDAVHVMLSAQFAGMSQIRALFVADADGTMLLDSRRYPLPRINVADRAYFGALRGGARGMFIGEPVVGRLDGLTSLTMAQRLEGPNGEFQGVIAAAVEPRFFRDLYASIELGADATIALYRRDSVLLASFPAELAALERRQDIAAIAEKGRGVMRVTGQAGEGWLIGVEPLRSFPVVAVVSVPEKTALAGWRRQAAIFGAGGVGSAAVILLLLLGLS